ncbi:hypothetical protein ACFL1E_06220 [Candidatus Omnitrophota bacterium]
MKKALVAILVVAVMITGVVGFLPASYADDWGTAGKVLTGLAGLRLLTGGKIDIIGAMTGVNRDEDREYSGRRYAKHYCHEHRTWVPNLIWKKKYIPEHAEYDEEYGEIIVEAHYIKYQVERGGRWKYLCGHH